MRRMVAVWMAAALSTAAVAAWAAESQTLDLAGLKAEARENKALSRYLKTNGYPDVAEVKTLVDQPPWDDHEVTLYYFGRRREISFARARILGKPEVHTRRYQRDLTDSDVRELGKRPALEQADGAGGAAGTVGAEGAAATADAEGAAATADAGGAS